MQYIQLEQWAKKITITRGVFYVKLWFGLYECGLSD